MGSIEQAICHLRELSLLGVEVAVDDFGTGHSSLSYLHRLPIDTLKVDRSFVSQITECKESVAIVRAIIAMAGGLGLKIVAEGVETEEQLATLTNLGCEVIQGFLFSRPLHAEAVWEVLTPRGFYSQAARLPVIANRVDQGFAGETYANAITSLPFLPGPANQNARCAEKAVELAT
jgi:EAL domain-containing protein (putative c-di-GMP-specific phosphodiesterase class I)